MSPSSRFAAVLERLPGVRGWQEDFYRDLHAHPELSHQESATAAKVAGRLRDLRCEVHENVRLEGGGARLFRSGQRHVSLVSRVPPGPRHPGPTSHRRRSLGV